jgi:uncharacterized protein
VALLWIEHYVSTFLDRDIPQLGISIPAPMLFRFWLKYADAPGTSKSLTTVMKDLSLSHAWII